MGKLRLVLAVSAATMFAGAAIAEPSCGYWNWQSDGVYVQVCVNDDGSQHCYQASDESGTGAFEISC